MNIVIEKKGTSIPCNVFRKPCDKCGDLCVAENQKSNAQLKSQMFDQIGDLYILDSKSLCFGCFFKSSVRKK